MNTRWYAIALFCILGLPAGSLSAYAAEEEDDTDKLLSESAKDKAAFYDMEYNQNTYSIREVGKPILMEFGTVLASRDVNIVATTKADKKNVLVPGIEYTLMLRNGRIYTLAEKRRDKEAVFASGEQIILQIGGGYHRILPATKLPKEIKAPVGIKILK